MDLFVCLCGVCLSVIPCPNFRRFQQEDFLGLSKCLLGLAATAMDSRKFLEPAREQKLLTHKNEGFAVSRSQLLTGPGAF